MAGSRSILCLAWHWLRKTLGTLVTLCRMLNKLNLPSSGCSTSNAAEIEAGDVLQSIASLVSVNKAGQLHTSSYCVQRCKRGRQLEVVATVACPVTVGEEEATLNFGVNADGVGSTPVHAVDVVDLLCRAEERT